MAKQPPTPTTLTEPPTEDLPALLGAARTRIADLEQQLLEARRHAADTVDDAKADGQLRFGFPLLSEEAAAPMTGERVAFAFWEGKVGATRRQRYWSLFQGLYQANVRLKDGTPVSIPAHGMLWLLDNMRLSGEV